MKTYTITVDIMENTSQDVHSLPVYNQGDINTSVLNLNITQDDVPYDLTGSSVSVVFIKSDGTVVYQDSTNGLSVTNAIGGAVSVSLNTQTLASLGRVTGAVKIQNGSSTIETGGFYFVVKKSLTSNVSIASDNSIVPLQSLIKFKSFMATNQQTLFDLSDVGSYTPGQNRLNVVVGGVPQPPTAYTENTSTTFTLSEPLSTGTVVNVEWVQNGNMYIAGHNTTHQSGGGDALDVTKLVNYTEQIATPISNINASLADIMQVNVLNHEAKGDGSTDDSAAFQSAINYANANNKFLFIPAGYNFKITQTLNIPSYLTIVGHNYQELDTGTGTSKSLITSTANPLFQPSGYSGSQIDTRFNIEKVRINSNVTNDVFKGFSFQRSIIDRIYTLNANIVFNNCSFNGLTEVKHGFFYNSFTSFLIGTVVDSNVHHNYINGAVSGTNSNTIGFDLTYPTTCSIDHNYIDFWDIGIRAQTGDSWEIANNIIDCCRLGINSNINLVGCTISENKFIRIQSSQKSKWSNPNSNMTNPWSCVTGDAFRWVSIVNNKANDYDKFINFNGNGGFSHLFTSGNQSLVSGNDDIIDWLTSTDTSNSDNGKGIFLTELMYKQYATLPEARIFINALVVVSFVNQIINYNGKYLYNDGSGSWKDLTGVVVTS